MHATNAICSYCRELDAIGRLDGEEICVSCLEELLERENALAIADAAGNGAGDRLREMLPPLRRGLGSRKPSRPPHRFTVEEEELAEQRGRVLDADLADWVETAERRGRELDSELPPELELEPDELLRIVTERERRQ